MWQTNSLIGGDESGEPRATRASEREEDAVGNRTREALIVFVYSCYGIALQCGYCTDSTDALFCQTRLGLARNLRAA